MVAISYSPIKEVIVHEFIAMDMDDLLRSRITPAGNYPLYWCDGILFTFNSMPWTRDIVKDYLVGKVHWSEVQFTKLDKYSPVMTLNDDNYKAEMKIKIIDTTKSAVHRDFAKWLKGQAKL